MFRMINRMEFAETKVLKRDRLNSVIVRNDFNKSVRRRNNESTIKFRDEIEESIEKINDIMVAEEIFNTKIGHIEGENMFFEVMHLYLATPGTAIQI